MLTAGGMTLFSACGTVGSESGTAKNTATAPESNPAPASSPASSSAAPTPQPAGTPTPAAPSTAPSAKPSGKTPAEPEYYVHGGPMELALTLDDGPSPVYTPQVLAILRRHGVTATFFLIGANVEKFPDIVRQIVDDGHHLGNHTWSHPDLGTLSAGQTRDEMERTSDIIARSGRGQRPTLFRAPGGFFTHASMALCGELGLRPVSWSVDPRDWSRPGTQKIVDEVLGHARAGSIILDHDGSLLKGTAPVPGSPEDRSQTVAALDTYLPRLIGDGYRFTALDPAA